MNSYGISVLVLMSRIKEAWQANEHSQGTDAGKHCTLQSQNQCSEPEPEERIHIMEPLQDYCQNRGENFATQTIKIFRS